MFCINCGIELPESSKFCSNCGTKISTPKSDESNSEPNLSYNSETQPFQDDQVSKSTKEKFFPGILPTHYDKPDLYANLRARFDAWIIDKIIFTVPIISIAYLVNIAISRTTNIQSYKFNIGAAIFYIFAWWLYYSIFESSRLQATPGKRAHGFKVTNCKGKPISFGRASTRYFGKILSVATLGIGLIMTVWTARKQALHDMVAGCLVVRREGLEHLKEGVSLPLSSRALAMPAWAKALVAVAVCLVIAIPLLGAIAIPQYNNYLVRSQVSQGLHIADKAEAPISNFYYTYYSFPHNNNEVGLAAPTSIARKYVSSVKIRTSNDGKGIIKIKFSKASNSVLHGKYLILKAHPQKFGGIIWSCDDSSVPVKYLPSGCD